MDINEIREHYTAKNLEEIAEKLPRQDAFKMYESAEAIARIIVGKAAFCAACATEPGLKESAKQHLHKADLWAEYLAERKAKYKE